ncbi:MAG: DNA methyltransferase [Burkholderiales bacterium]
MNNYTEIYSPIGVSTLDTSSVYIKIIKDYDNELYNYFSNKIKVDRRLNRKIVSFQANKTEPFYRWYKYKEAFSASLVEFLLSEYSVPIGTILDPFAGMGTALFKSAELGYDSVGIELLPIGQKIIEARKSLIFEYENNTITILTKWLTEKPWHNTSKIIELNELNITSGAYPQETKQNIEKYLSAIEFERGNVSDNILDVLLFALLCILESISYTRKDGQYLRWDYRSERKNGKNTFNKGKIYEFDEAISLKLIEIIDDIEYNHKNLKSDLFQKQENQKIGDIRLDNGSCIEIMQNYEDCSIQSIVTSPPYCNRYDYTRTYALELALLGIGERELVELRQTMLSCTVENKPKELEKLSISWGKAINICDSNKLLQSILYYLEFQKNNKKLNNNGIPRMVRGYFYETACLIQESFRVLKPGGLFFMVNDNVRYDEIPISVDMILSKIAEEVGFDIENIIVLPQTKGNSSQQMGKYGKNEMRKCVYIWRKS